MSEFIPIYEYAQKTGQSNQNVYRLIRENRFDEEDITTEEKTVTRIKIRKDATPKLLKKKNEV